MSTRMTAKNKTFILKRLIPFILREQGRGFGMSVWKADFYNPGESVRSDGITRKVPSCGTVACIGGSIQALLLKKTSEHDYIDDTAAGAKIGLDADQSYGLFYHWTIRSQKETGYGWPEKYARMYDRAKTVYHKARVAAALLREVVRTGGKCLDPAILEQEEE